MDNPKKLISERDILDLFYSGKKSIDLTGNEIITPAAFDILKEKGIKINKVSFQSRIQTIAQDSFENLKKVAVGSDHTGFGVKKIIVKYFEENGYKVIDVGTTNENSCDYPDFAVKVAKLVVLGEVFFGVLLDATGIPSAITANKIPGIRAATCYNEFSARSAREHNNANILVMGAKTLGEETIKSVLNTFLKYKFLGERHQKRLDKISKLEENFLKNKIE